MLDLGGVPLKRSMLTPPFRAIEQQCHHGNQANGQEQREYDRPGGLGWVGHRQASQSVVWARMRVAYNDGPTQHIAGCCASSSTMKSTKARTLAATCRREGYTA